MRAIGVAWMVLGVTCASAADWSGELALEQRMFTETSPQSLPEGTVSLRGRVGAVHAWNDDADSLEVLVRGRIDEHDEARTGAEVLDFAWIRVRDDWEWRSGIRTVFWGVTESRHLVDIINQTDAVDQIDGEEKLGQPMINVSRWSEAGTLDLFLLPGFRERPFPGRDGRPGLPRQVDNPLDAGNPFVLELDDPRFESGAGATRMDAALRFKWNVEALEAALSHFSGTSRDPQFTALGGTRFALEYPVIDQTGLELQYNVDAWLLKLEAISRSGMQNGRYAAATGGLEYTFSGVAASSTDVGVVIEYQADERGENSPDPGEHDWMLGVRGTFNDVDDTHVLLATIIDARNHERVVTLESRKRFGDVWGGSVQAFFLHGRSSTDTGFDPDAKLQTFYQDDLVQAEIVRYF